MTGGKKRYDQDMIVVGVFLLLMFALYLGTDAASGPTDLFKTTYGPRTGEGPDGPDGPKNKDPIIEQETLVDETGFTSEGTTTEIAFEVPWNTTIELSISLEWTDDYGDNDEFELVLYQEDERVEGVTGTSGHLELTQGSPSSGNYSVRVSALDCPGRVPTLPRDQDEGNGWTLEVRTTYEVIG